MVEIVEKTDWEDIKESNGKKQKTGPDSQNHVKPLLYNDLKNRNQKVIRKLIK